MVDDNIKFNFGTYSLHVYDKMDHLLVSCIPILHEIQRSTPIVTTNTYINYYKQHIQKAITHMNSVNRDEDNLLLYSRLLCNLVEIIDYIKYNCYEDTSLDLDDKTFTQTILNKSVNILSNKICELTTS